MDTNLVVALPKVATISLEWAQLIPALIAAIFAFAAWLQSRTIHKIVNSAQSAAVERERTLTATVLKLSEQVATLREDKRGVQIAADVKAASLPTKS